VTGRHSRRGGRIALFLPSVLFFVVFGGCAAFGAWAKSDFAHGLLFAASVVQAQVVTSGSVDSIKFAVASAITSPPAR